MTGADLRLFCRTSPDVAPAVRDATFRRTFPPSLSAFLPPRFGISFSSTFLTRATLKMALPDRGVVGVRVRLLDEFSGVTLFFIFRAILSEVSKVSSSDDVSLSNRTGSLSDDSEGFSSSMLSALHISNGE